MKKRKRLGAFVKALFHHWWILLFSLLSLISTTLTYVPVHVPKLQLLPVGLAFVLILVASFYAYCDQGEAQDSLQVRTSGFEKRLAESEQSVASLETRLHQEQLANGNLLAEVQKLKQQVATLSVKPYDEQKLVYARSQLSSLRYFERDLLRFLLVNGDSRGDAISLAATNTPGGFELGSLSHVPVQRGLIHRAEDHLSGYSTFSLNRDLRDVLKDVLFPRVEEKPSLFKGLDNAV
jgi:hypothetical protein